MCFNKAIRFISILKRVLKNTIMRPVFPVFVLKSERLLIRIDSVRGTGLVV